jgi:cysteine desulfurase
MKEPRIYLDYNASAPLRMEARRAMEAVLDGGPSNASSVHGDGQRG